MNTIEKYEFFRNMPGEDFEVFKFIYNNSCTSTFENIAKVVRCGIAGLLAYFAYDNYDVNTTLSILSGISSFFLLFPKWCTGLIPSYIGTIRVMRSDKRSEAVKNIARVVSKYKPEFKERAERMVKKEEKLTKLEQEG